MTDLITWLRAQLDLDERRTERMRRRDASDPTFTIGQRVLRQVQAHRAILDLIERDIADDADDQAAHHLLGILASIYSDRGGYREEWRP